MKRLNGHTWLARSEPLPETAEPFEERPQVMVDAKKFNQLLEQLSDVLACNGGGTLSHQVRAQTKRAAPQFLGLFVILAVFPGIPLVIYAVAMITSLANRDAFDRAAALRQDQKPQSIEVRRAELVKP